MKPIESISNKDHLTASGRFFIAITMGRLIAMAISPTEDNQVNILIKG